MQLEVLKLPNPISLSSCAVLNDLKQKWRPNYDPPFAVYACYMKTNTLGFALLVFVRRLEQLHLFVWHQGIVAVSVVINDDPGY